MAADEFADKGLRALVAPRRDAADFARALADPAIGGFDVQTIINSPRHEVERAVARFFSASTRDETLILYFSGHGIKDDRGLLYFATPDTELDLLSASAVAASFVSGQLDRGRAETKIVVLDCCYSGAFSGSPTMKSSATVNATEELRGIGRVIITASNAMQYSFEGPMIEGGVGTQSVFTKHLVKGLETGNADLDGDGRITVDELYRYVHDEVVRENPRQRPSISIETQGLVILATSPAGVRPAALSEDLLVALENPLPRVRLAATWELIDLLRSSDSRLAASSRARLEQLASDDSHRVSEASKAALEELPAPSIERGDGSAIAGLVPPATETGFAAGLSSDRDTPATPVVPDEASMDAPPSVDHRTTRPAVGAAGSDCGTGQPRTQAIPSRIRRLAIVAGVIGLIGTVVVVVASNGTDNDPPTNVATATSTPITAKQTDFQGYCEDMLAMETLSGPEIDLDSVSQEEAKAAQKQYGKEVVQPLLDDLRASAPSQIAGDLAVVFTATEKVIASGDFEPFDTQEYLAAKANVHAFDIAHCGWIKAEVTGVEYSFRGLAATVAAGPTSFEFRNLGAELHELAVVRKKPGVTKPYDEILQFSEDPFSELEVMAVAIAKPGQTAHGVADLDAGDYLAVCAIHVGITSQDDPEIHKPPFHFTQGMKAEFKVL